MKWTTEKDEKLKRLLKIMSDKNAAIELGISKKSVDMRAWRLGIHINRYNFVTVYCKNCNKEIGIFKENTRYFCSRNCSASFMNKLRTPESRKKQSETVKKTLLQKGFILKENRIKSKRKESIPPIFKNCKSCKKELYNTYKFICDDCKNLYYKYYRTECNFKFSIKKYSYLFSEEDINLLIDKGMYSASNKGNNKEGISRDHKFSVKNGFILFIKSFIIAHPANCKLLIHTENQKKNSKSSIFLNDLYQDIIKSEEIERFLSDEQLEYVKTSFIESVNSSAKAME